MHDNIIQLLFLESIKNRVEHLETHRKDGKLIIDIRLKKRSYSMFNMSRSNEVS